MHHHHEPVHWFGTIFGSIVFLLLIAIYIVGVMISNKKYSQWPLYRIVLWSLGIICIAISLVGPIAEKAHNSFQSHMMTHLLLGMLGPLLLVFSAPITLLLRCLKVQHARIVSRILKSKYVEIVSHPIIATVLNMGGLWVLYVTPLYNAMHSSILLYSLIHFHVFLAGYVFTASMISFDPSPHRYSFIYRSIVLVLAMASHSILSKWIYANPPQGIDKFDAEMGGIIMYYGGDFIDLIIVIVLCAQYFRRTQMGIRKKELSEKSF
ncbi:cytochrome c oxidase assembly protein [Ureibacillus endophyticus]|uniref:Cytochrome c oxidase assembly protein n=1 Tax=Ureibacillus endophyticus TaxID=1978490 RepID=A0A494Z3V5_9BACL|nr:cytochrome c oxidase assembly protein [Lysinibacillus endophyticus]RKQ16992.1 cytochrome c oxidase assembly protein [Lysinibacillus endophyticus]